VTFGAVSVPFFLLTSRILLSPRLKQALGSARVGKRLSYLHDEGERRSCFG
jgi:hypothetical protein